MKTHKTLSNACEYFLQLFQKTKIEKECEFYKRQAENKIQLCPRTTKNIETFFQ